MPLFFGFRTKGLCIEVGERKRWFGFVSGFLSLVLKPFLFTFVQQTSLL